MLKTQALEREKNKVKTSEDNFFRGRFSALQPIGTGHRSGLDALLIAAGLPLNAKGLVVDLGSGSGVAGMAAACANLELTAVLVEKNKLMVDLANKSLGLEKNQHFATRLRVLEADVMLSGLEREKKGLAPNMADFVIMNPPYNHEGQRASPDKIKAEAHVMGVSGLDSWMRTAAAILKPGGTLIMIYRTEKLGEVIACSTGRFGGVSIVAVHSKEHEPAKRLIFKMKKGSRAPLKILPCLVIHNDEGGPTDVADSLLNGDARISFNE